MVATAMSPKETMVGMMLGRISRARMRVSLAPSALAASTKSRVAYDSVEARTTRKIRGAAKRPMTSVILNSRLAPEGDDGDDGDDGGEGQHHVGAGVEDGVDPAPAVGRDHGGDAADDQADQRAAEAHHQRDPRPVDQAAEDVAVEVVGAEEVAPAGPGVLGRCCSSRRSGWAAAAGWRRWPPMPRGRSSRRRSRRTRPSFFLAGSAASSASISSLMSAKASLVGFVRLTLLTGNPRVDDGEQEVEDEVDQHDGHGDEQGDALHDGVVVLVDAEISWYPRPGICNRSSTMNVPAIRPPMVTPADASSEMEDGRRAWRHMMRRSESPFERAMVMKSSCSVEMRSFRSNRK